MRIKMSLKEMALILNYLGFLLSTFQYWEFLRKFYTLTSFYDRIDNRI